MIKDMLGPIFTKIRKLPVLSLGAVSDLLDKLPGKFGAEWLAELKRFNRREACWIFAKRGKKPPFGRFLMTVETLATTTSEKTLFPDRYIRKISEIGKCRSGLVDEMLEYTSFHSLKPEKYDLYMVSGFDLGFTEMAKRKDIFNQAICHGFELCPTQAITQAFINYEISTGCLQIAMEPIIREIFTFRVDYKEEMLDSETGGASYPWNPEVIWVFVWPRNK